MIVTVRRGGAGRAALVEAGWPELGCACWTAENEARRARADGEPPPAIVDLDHLNEED